MSLKLWLRDEVKDNERRTPLTPQNAKELLEMGVKITVEASVTRAFKNSDYEDVGCHITQDHWTSAPLDYTILGLKEIPIDDKTILVHKHIYFAHSFKGQEDANATLSSFKKGGGTLFDLEYLTYESGQRIAAFGTWAGFVGMSMAINHFYERSLQKSSNPLLSHYTSKEDLLKVIHTKQEQSSKKPRILIIGARGRCGQGALQAAVYCSLAPTLWDSRETKPGGPFKKINEH